MAGVFDAAAGQVDILLPRDGLRNTSYTVEQHYSLASAQLRCLAVWYDMRTRKLRRAVAGSLRGSPI